MIGHLSAFSLSVFFGFVLGLAYFYWLSRSVRSMTRANDGGKGLAVGALLRFASVLTTLAALLALGVSGVHILIGGAGFLISRFVSTRFYDMIFHGSEKGAPCGGD